MKTFMRYEKKYLLNERKYSSLMKMIGSYLKEDNYGKSTICNIYFDTENFELIRSSILKPIYKEKLRLRSYGVAGDSSTIFAELKKKYKGIVYKRREMMTLREGEAYFYDRENINKDSQVLREISWFMNHYKSISERMYISYEREAFFSGDDIRITFDRNILYREEDLKLSSPIGGDRVINEGSSVMEIKINGGMPMWLYKSLNSLSIYPESFSKYGMAYKMREGHVKKIYNFEEIRLNA